MADDVVLDVLIELKERGLEMVTLISNHLEDLNSTVKDVNQSLEKMADRAHEDARAMLELAGASRIAAVATGRGQGGLLASLVQLMPGGTVMGAAITGVLAFGLAFPAVIAAVAATTVLLGAFTVGVAALVTTMALGLAPLLLLGGAVAYLAVQAQGGVNANKALEAAHKAVVTQTKLHDQALQDLKVAEANYQNLHSAANREALFIAQSRVAATSAMLQTAMDDQHAAAVGLHSAVSGLGAAFGDMVDTWTVQAIPIAYKLITAFQGMVVPITNAGTALLTWFDQRLRAVMPLIQGMLGTTGSLLLSVGIAIGHVTDFMIARAPQFQAFFKGIADVGGRAVIGLIDNLLRLSDWFLQRLPQIAPIVGSIFGGIGRVIQAIGTVAGVVVDFFIKHWPEITDAAGKMFAAVKSGWDQMAGPMQLMLGALGRGFEVLGIKMKDLSPIAYAIGLAAGIIITAFEAIGVAVLAVVIIIERFIAGIQWIINHAIDITKAFGQIGVSQGHIVIPGSSGGSPSGYHPPSSVPPLVVTHPPPPSGGSGHRLAASYAGGTTILPVVFSPIPPNREQMLIIREQLRRLDRAQT